MGKDNKQDKNQDKKQIVSPAARAANTAASADGTQRDNPLDLPIGNGINKLSEMLVAENPENMRNLWVHASDSKYTLRDERRLLESPNAEADRDLLIAINGGGLGGRPAGGTSSRLEFLGKLVPPDELGFSHTRNGKARVHLPGRHLNVNPNITYAFKLNQKASKPLIKYKNIRIMNIPDGHIGKAFVGKTKSAVLLEQGRHAKNDPDFKVEEDYINYNKTLNEEGVIQHGTITIIRTKPNEIALAWLGNKPKIIAPDNDYIVNSTEFTYVENSLIDYDKELNDKGKIIHGTISIVRVKPGKIGLALYKGKPIFLGEGTHAHDDLNFKFTAFADASEDHYKFQAATIFRLKAGELACLQDKDNKVEVLKIAGRYVISEPVLLLNKYSVNEGRVEHDSYQRVRLQAGKIIFYQDKDGQTCYHDKPGTYELQRPEYFDEKIYDINTAIIHFEATVRLNLKQGEIAYYIDGKGQTCLVEKTGVKYITRPSQFLTLDTSKVSDEILQLGSTDVINVAPEHVAITYDARPADGDEKRGARILHEGHHVLDHELWTLKEIVSVQERSEDISSKNVYSKNRVRFDVDAFITYKITDPEKAFIRIDDIKTVLAKKATSTILSIFGSYFSEQIAKGVETHSTGPDGETISKMTSFADIVQKEFLEGFKEFANARGIELTMMNVGSLDFSDETMRATVEQQAKMAITIEADRENIGQQMQTEVLKVQGQAKANLAREKAGVEESRVKAEALGIKAAGEMEASKHETTARVYDMQQVFNAQKGVSTLSSQLLIIEALGKAEAERIGAISEKATVIPMDIKVTHEGFSNKVAQYITRLDDAQFEVKSGSSTIDGEFEDTNKPALQLIR